MAGLLSLLVAALHIAIIFLGAPAYRYFGAGERMAQLATSGSLLPAGVTFVLAMGFATFGLYGLSGGGYMRRLPLLRTGLVVVAALYTLRGLSLLPQLLSLGARPGRFVAFSAVSLGIGLAYTVGVFRRWSALRKHTPAVVEGEQVTR